MIAWSSTDPSEPFKNLSDQIEFILLRSKIRIEKMKTGASKLSRRN